LGRPQKHFHLGISKKKSIGTAVFEIRQEALFLPGKGFDLAHSTLVIGSRDKNISKATLKE